MLTRPPTFVHLKRYARVYHRTRREYGHAIAPGPVPQMVLFACGNIVTPVSRYDLRPLRWYERLLNR